MRRPTGVIIIPLVITTVTFYFLATNSPSLKGDGETGSNLTETTRTVNYATVIKPFPAVDIREDIGKILELEKMKVGAELGVQRGVFAKVTLEHWPSCERYYLVDIWRQQVCTLTYFSIIRHYSTLLG